jgi:hypothetical protein
MESCGKHEKLQDAYLRFAHRLVAELAKQEPVKREEHVCGLQGFGALGDVCPACAAPVIPAELDAVMADAQSWRNLENKMTAAAPKG